MMIKRKFLFSTTVLAGVIAVAAPAFAQSSGSARSEESAQVDEVVVTGSRIRRDPTTSPTPLIQVKGEEILSAGQSTLIDYLAQIPALSNSQIPSDNVGTSLNTGGLAIGNLRALGSARTLTLIDGRRHVGSVGGSLAVSVNTVPRLLIQNVEIITGGASSVYGADAVAGVLNFNLRKDFQGLEIDARYGQQTRSGKDSYRLSGVVGQNFFDDRLNVYLFGEYEQLDEVSSMDLDWIRRGPVLVGVDADPTSTAIGPNTDGRIDNLVFSGLSRLDRPRWGQTTIANVQQPSPQNNPNVPTGACTSYTAAACYSVDPAKTWWFPEDGSARLANFGQRIGNTGLNRPFTIGGDGEPVGLFSQDDRLPETKAYRFQTGANLRVTDNITGYVEAKYTREDTYSNGQPTFFDFYLNDAAQSATGTVVINNGNQNHFMRWSDNAFLPDAVKNAIRGNTVVNYLAPGLDTPGQPGTVTTQAPWARHTLFGPERPQTNRREIQRYVAALSGNYDNILGVKNVGWDIGYTYGRLDNHNNERAVDVQRFTLAADSVIDSAGLVNGKPGEIVCRVRLLAAQNIPLTGSAPGVAGLRDYVRGGNGVGNVDLRASAEGRAAINECQPLNIFGKGRQSDAALKYVDAAVNVTQINEQNDLTASVSGQLWDFWGAGAIGVAIGGEYRKEYTEGTGRSRDVGDRQLFLNSSPDQPGVSYESKEVFAELSLPLFRDSFLGQYAELSGSYRYSDYTTVGSVDVYGVNLVYRPVTDISFKTSYNTSVRVPTLGEQFSPYSQTFANAFVDPCSTASINASSNAQYKDNRIANCTALASAKGLSYDFAGSTATTDDDYDPIYNSGIAGVNGGNRNLKPEESTSFTFSTVYTPHFIPRLSLVLDYYEIQIDQVISAVTAQVAANNCVNGPGLNQGACSTIFRKVNALANPTNRNERSEAFKVGAPSGDAIGGFIQGSINYAKRTVRGLDFTANYSIDTAEMFGRDWGRISTSLSGSWLIEQKYFTNIDDPSAYDEYAGLLSTGGSYPRVRFAHQLTWEPNDTVGITLTSDFQTSQSIVKWRDLVRNVDDRPVSYTNTGNFIRNDLLIRYKLSDDATVRFGVTNLFNKTQPDYLGTTLYSNFDPYGRRFNVSLNWRPF